MSTGDVRRPSTAKQTKAVAADLAKPDPDDETPEVDTPEADTEASSEPATAPRSGAGGSRASRARSAGAKSAGAGSARAKSAGGGSARAKSAGGASAGGGSAPAAKSSGAASAGTKSAATGSGTKSSATSGTTDATSSGMAGSTRSSSVAAAGTRAAAGTKTGAAKTGSATRPAAKARPGARPQTQGGGKGRKPIKPVKVHQERNWGPIAMFVGAGVVAILIIGFAAVQLYRQSNQPTWQDRAKGIDGMSNLLQTNPEWFKFGPEGNHKAGPLSYPMTPPAGGVHNDKWQNCMGDVYTAPVAKEHAVHSLEHGAVWVTYRPDLPQDQIDELAGKVRDKSFLFMSPFPGLDRPISLQAWGYQLKVDEAGDGRIDEFIDALRQNATQEPGATCSGGITEPAAVPFDLPATNQ